jgi:hypothetical protein
MTSAPVTDATSAGEPELRSASTLGEAFRIFASHLSPVLIMAITLVLVVARLLVTEWRIRELIVVAAVFALQPFVEWTTHVWVLHAKPRRVLGREIDLYVAKKHRRHHADPRNLDILSMPIPGLITLSLVTGGIAALLPSTAYRLTLGVMAAGSLLVYEWIHFLIHTDYKPKTAAYRRLYQSHRLHHFRNENYWFGVARLFGDKVLGTAPAKQDVPISPTVKALLG